MSTLTTLPPTAYAPAPRLVTVPPTSYLTVEGTGSPRGKQFQAAIQAVFPVAYTIKMQLKLEGHDFKVGPIEAQWWVDGDRNQWRWKVLMRVPDLVDGQLMKLTRDTLVNKRRLDAAADVRLERLEEGACVEAVHIGPYGTEAGTLELMHAFMIESKFRPAGAHHEIYLSDPRRTPPQKLRTLLRQPVA
jgi:hypothetical protein